MVAHVLRNLRASWDDRVRARRDSAAWRVADLLLRHPVVNAALVANELGIDTPNVYRQIVPLEEAGVLKEFTDQKRNRVWRSPEVLTALDDFARRGATNRELIRRVPSPTKSLSNRVNSRWSERLLPAGNDVGVPSSAIQLTIRANCTAVCAREREPCRWPLTRGRGETARASVRAGCRARRPSGRCG